MTSPKGTSSLTLRKILSEADIEHYGQSSFIIVVVVVVVVVGVVYVFSET